MAGDVCVRIGNALVGKEGSVVINPNSLRIVPAFASRQRLSPKISTPVDAEATSGVYNNRFMYTEIVDSNIVSVSGVKVSSADLK